MHAHNARGRPRRVLREYYMVITEHDSEVTWNSYTKPITIKIDTETTCSNLIKMLLNRYIAGDGRALAVSVKTGSSVGIVCGIDVNGLVSGWVESLFETDAWALVLAVSVKIGGSTGVVCGIDVNGLVSGWVESLQETYGSLPAWVPVAAMANAQITFAV